MSARDNGLKPIGEILSSVIGAHVDGIQAGAQAAERRMFPAISALAAEYAKAQANLSLKIPTALSLAIEAVLSTARSPGDPFAERRSEPRARPEHDLDIAGRRLKAGS